MGKANADLLCEMLAARGELLKQLKGLRGDRAQTRPEPNEWSVVEVLQHVADIDSLMVRRFGEIKAGKAELSPNTPADWEAARSAAERDGLAGVIRRLYATRTAVLDAVSDMEAADLERSAKHPRYGEMTMRQLVEMIVRHDLDHAQQIAKTRAVVER